MSTAAPRTRNPAPDASRDAPLVLAWCLEAGLGFEARAPYPDIWPFAVVEIRGGIKVVHAGRDPMAAWRRYLQSRGGEARGRGS
jgi:hypothetical protein